LFFFVNRDRDILLKDMTYIYQITDWKKSFYFLTKQQDENKALEKYEKMYDKYKAGKSRVINDVFEIFDSNEEYCILLVWSYPDRYGNVCGGSILRDIIGRDLSSCNKI
jgi:hypothetical protein